MSTSPVSTSLPPPPSRSSPTTPSSTSLVTQPARSHHGSHPNQPTSQVQLAAILHETLRENELLKRELSVSKRNADKYERMVTLIQNSPQSTSAQPSSDTLPPSAMKRIMDYETRLERAELERDQARIRIMQEIWAQLDQYLSQCEFRAKDAREGFNKILQEAGGQLHPMTKEQWHLNLPDIPYPNSNSFPSPTYTYIPSDRQPRSLTSRPIHRQAPPNSLQMVPTMLINSNGNNGNTSLPTFSLPPHPSGSNRIRPRAESLDRHNYSTGPPPAKKHRGEGVYRDDTQRYSGSPQNAVHSQPASSSTEAGQVHPHQQHSRRLRYQSDADSPAVRARSPHRPQSRSSSTSLDEMLLEATSNNPDAQHTQQQSNMFTYPQPQPHQRRSASPNSHSQSPVNPRGVMFSGQSQGGVLHSYQTHIFAPPVTGAPPVKKSNTVTSMSGGMSRGGSLAGNSQSGHHGAHVLGPGGYPATNAQGQRICRQCGLVGRYKDGKCVEKWGPGPEGPGTVCDKCRKKMKRVERRGTIESQQQREQREQHQQVQQALAHHRSQQHIQPAPPSPVDASERTSSTTSVSSVRRADTMVVGPGMNYDSQRMPSSRMEDSRLPPIAAAPLHSRSGDVSRREVHVVHVSTSSTNGNGMRRSIPTPPYIATLPGSNEHDEDDREFMRLEKNDLNLMNGSVVGMTSNGHSARHEQQPQQQDRDRASSRHTPDAQPPPGGGGGGSGGSHMEVDDADGDAEGEEDAEADLLEAVDAAEEAHHLKEKSNCGGSRSSRGGDADDVDEEGGEEGDGEDEVEMKIEEEI